MNKALKLTNGVNFLPRNKIFNKKKKVNLWNVINKSPNKTFDYIFTYLDKTFISFLLINKFRKVKEFQAKWLHYYKQMNTKL
jgi:hypothetical protein